MPSDDRRVELAIPVGKVFDVVGVGVSVVNHLLVLPRFPEAALRHRGRTVAAPAFRVEVVDTTGAGDVYHGALLAGLLWRWPISAILRLANAAASLKCRRLGGRAGIPTLAETRAFLGGLGVELPSIP